MNETNYRIDKKGFHTLLIWAVIYDVLSIIPILNIFSKTLSLLHFHTMLGSRGVKISENPKMLINLAISTVIGFIPFVSILPETIFFVFRITAISRAEDLVRKTLTTPTKSPLR